MRTQLLTYASFPMRSSRLWSLVVGFAIVGSACTKTNPVLECDKSGTCTDPRFPFCDATGAVAGDPGKCIAVACTAGTFAACDGDNELVCDAAGTNYEAMHCANGCSATAGGCIPCLPNMQACGDGMLYSCDTTGSATAVACDVGCVDSPTPHCGAIDPRHLPGVCDQPAQASRVVGSSTTLDTSIDTNCTAIVSQTGGPGICVLRYKSFQLASAATLRVSSAPQGGAVNNVKNRPIAIVVDDELIIDGLLDASGGSGVPSPGGGFATSGGTTQAGTNGLGGAGFATPGGNGGTFQADGGAQNGGPALPNPISTAVFTGGPANIGLGGGAVMLVSCRGDVKVAGTVHVGGGGGPSGYLTGLGCVSGMGGGAGGNVLIEGARVEITGSLYANGGGGGAGCVGNTQATQEQNGEDGPMSDVSPAHGGVAVSGAGAGGKGGLGTSAPGDGRAAQMNVGTPGGGGGSFGWLETSTPAGNAPTLTPAHVSPPLQPNATSTVK